MGRTGLAEQSSASGAVTRMFAVLNFVEVAAGRADKDVLRVSPVLGHEIAGKQVERYCQIELVTDRMVQ